MLVHELKCRVIKIFNCYLKHCVKGQNSNVFRNLNAGVEDCKKSYKAQTKTKSELYIDVNSDSYIFKSYLYMFLKDVNN